MKSMKKSLDNVLNRVSLIRIDTSILESQELDVERVNWYKERFELFVEDKVPMAIIVYLEKLNKEDVNDITRLTILHIGIESQNKCM